MGEDFKSKEEWMSQFFAVTNSVPSNKEIPLSDSDDLLEKINQSRVKLNKLKESKFKGPLSDTILDEHLEKLDGLQAEIDKIAEAEQSPLEAAPPPPPPPPESAPEPPEAAPPPIPPLPPSPAEQQTKIREYEGRWQDFYQNYLEVRNVITSFDYEDDVKEQKLEELSSELHEIIAYYNQLVAEDIRMDPKYAESIDYAKNQILHEQDFLSIQHDWLNLAYLEDQVKKGPKRATATKIEEYKEQILVLQESIHELKYAIANLGQDPRISYILDRLDSSELECKKQLQRLETPGLGKSPTVTHMGETYSRIDKGAEVGSSAAPDVDLRANPSHKPKHRGS